MYNINSSGPTIDPQGTPLVTYYHEKLLPSRLHVAVSLSVMNFAFLTDFHICRIFVIFQSVGYEELCQMPFSKSK